MGRLDFSVQEAKNAPTYIDWNYEELDLNDEATTITDETCDLTDDPTIAHDTNAAILKGYAVTGAGIPAGSYVGVKTSTEAFELYKDGSPVSTTGGAASDVTLTFKGGADSETSSYITSLNPAKKVVLYVVPGGGGDLEDIDVLTLTINGKTDTQKKMLIDSGDLPFTLEGVLITSLAVSVAQANLDNALSVLSFH